MTYTDSLEFAALLFGAWLVGYTGGYVFKTLRQFMEKI